MSSLDDLLASYLDLSRHLDPLRHPHEAPLEVHRRLGRFDLPWLVAQESSLRSIANAIEDLEGIESLDDEVDRTMLIDTVRSETVRLAAEAHATTTDHGLPVRHARAALDAVLGEDFEAAHEAALRERLRELPDFLATLRTDTRPAPAFFVAGAQRATESLHDRLDAAAERINEESVVACRLAVTDHLAWLAAAERVGGEPGIGDEAVAARLRTLTAEPLGVKGTLRTLELRRAGVERSLDSAAADLGADSWPEAVDQLRDEASLDPMDRFDAWAEEWQRVGAALEAAGLPVSTLPPPAAPDIDDAWSLAGLALRGHARRMFDLARSASPRPVRRLLVAPGLSDGWGRTVAALLREHDVLGTPERRLMSAHLAMRDAVAAETDLLLQARLASPSQLVDRAATLVGLLPYTAEELVIRVAETPMDSLAAALAHEAWQGWYAEVGESPVDFLTRALSLGGLAVPLARWASAVGQDNN